MILQAAATAIHFLAITVAQSDLLPHATCHLLLATCVGPIDIYGLCGHANPAITRLTKPQGKLLLSSSWKCPLQMRGECSIRSQRFQEFKFPLPPDTSAYLFITVVAFKPCATPPTPHSWYAPPLSRIGRLSSMHFCIKLSCWRGNRIHLMPE